ncbi:hypothetical protein LBMAG38_22260 [Chloroflexota bacterium]|nr:hypothetical protein LBMAG38_22260 [Chloroflexota bacterium]
MVNMQDTERRLGVETPVVGRSRRAVIWQLASIAGMSGTLFAACASPLPGGDAAGSKEAGADGIVHLQKMAWGSALEKESIEKGIALFHEQQPKIRVEYLHQPDAYDDKLQALLAAGTAPDVFKVAGNLYADYIAVNALMDVTDRVLKDSVIGKPDYFLQPFERERSTFNGKWYGVGSTAQERLLFYNVESLKQAGVTPPPVDPGQAWTWSDFQQFARRMTVRNGDVTQKLGGHWPNGDYGPAVVSNGGRIIDGKTMRFALDEPAAIDAIQKVADLTLKERVSATADDIKGGTEVQHLSTGKFSMMVGGNWLLLDLAPLGFKYGAGVLPKLNRPATTMASSSTAIWKATPKPEAAWSLFRFLNTDDYQIPLVQKGLWNPSHTSLLSTVGVKKWFNPTVHPEGYDRLVIDYMAKFGYADIPMVGVRKGMAVISEDLKQVWAGKAAAADVLKDSVSRANKVLELEQARVGK